MKYFKYLPVFLLGLFWSCEGDDNAVVQEINTVVNAIVIDKNNTKWIGTDNGLYKSIEEGYELQKLAASGKIYSLYYEASENIIWIGTKSALLKANISTGKITDEVVPNDKLSNPTVLTLHIDSDSKRWFGTEKGFSLNYGEIWKTENFRINDQDKLFAMEIEEFPVNSIASWEGDYFFATSGAKLYRAFDYDASVDAFSGATQWDSPYNGESITDTMFVVFIDKDGNQWMGGKEGIQVHSGNNPKDLSSFTYYYDELPDYYVLAITQATNGDIWVGTRKGLSIFNGSGWETITNGLPDLYVTSIAFDKDGGAWIGTKKGLANIE